MKLRNKKTGEIIDRLCIHICSFDVEGNECKEIDTETRSLEKVLEVWEDYKPKKPLIEDEKIRKLVSDWAKLTQTNKILIVERRTARGEKLTEFFSQEKYMSMEILDRFDLLDMKEYDVAELCGEKEE